MRYVSTKEQVMWAALAETETLGSGRPAKGPELTVKGMEGGGDGIFASRMRVMDERWTPASTAMSEPRRHS